MAHGKLVPSWRWRLEMVVDNTDVVKIGMAPCLRMLGGETHTNIG